MAVEKEYILDGNTYTASDLELLAQDEGVLVDDIIEGYGFEENLSKQQLVTNTLSQKIQKNIQNLNLTETS